MPYKLVGRTSLHKGKRLWEIVGQLKNFGVGRMVVRNTFEQQYKEPTFYRIVVARPMMDVGEPHANEDNRKGRALLERVFRGRHEGVVDISKVSYKADFRLIHKHEEAAYIEAYKNCKTPDITLISPVVEMPPLLKMVAERDGHAAKDLKIKLHKTAKTCRLAQEGEVPTKVYNMGLGTPVSPALYEGVI
ncbi:28S ribosomal protein S34, mitochondrial [Chionoecetes opilio]|uniref:28S ribosomal protein S34, mitochondrial n=1 Tax=Chionoecetes opilio TaxID=41210 RepID=A0A8J5CJN3_CHIOP|nr:28S ribosomal protein S34, mitochondrial [Chionoecetes opilio]